MTSSFRFVECHLPSRGNSVYRYCKIIASFLIRWSVTTRELSHRVYIPIESFNESNEFRRRGGQSSLTIVEVAELQDYPTCYHSVGFFTYSFKKYLPTVCITSSETKFLCGSLRRNGGERSSERKTSNEQL